MPISQLQMQSTMARLGHQVTSARQEIVQTPANLSIEQPKADLQINTSPPTLTIDQTQAWEEMNLKSIFRLNEQFSQEGYQAWLEALAANAQEGDQLMRIENGGGAIAQLAKQNSDTPYYESRLTFIPSTGSVKIHIEPGAIQIDAIPRKPVIEAQTHKPDIQYTPGNVKFYMEQYQSLNMYLADSHSVQIEI